MRRAVVLLLLLSATSARAELLRARVHVYGMD